MAGQDVEAISLDWLATRPDRHYLANQCRAWAAAFDGFRYAAHADRDPAQGARRMVEALAAELPLAVARRVRRRPGDVRRGGGGGPCATQASRTRSSGSPWSESREDTMSERKVIPINPVPARAATAAVRSRSR